MNSTKVFDQTVIDLLTEHGGPLEFADLVAALNQLGYHTNVGRPLMALRQAGTIQMQLHASRLDDGRITTSLTVQLPE